MRSLTLRLVAGTIGLAALAGCAVGPNFHRPAAPATDRYTPAPLPAQVGAATGTDSPPQRLVMGAPVDGRWWTLFGSPELDALEDEALSRNADIEAARAALRTAHETYLVQRASLAPAVQFAGNAQRAKNSVTIAPPLNSGVETYTLYDGQLNVTYVLDVFGGERRQTESVAAQAESQRFQTEAVYLTLTTNVANTVLTLAGLNAQLQATDKIIGADRRTFDITSRQKALGEVSGADVAAARTTLEQAEQLAPPIRKQIDQQRDLLAALLGRPPAQAPTGSLDLAGFTLPRDLPVSLPAELVRQRPDVRAAEANVHAASAQVGVAVAARLPSFTLDGAAGGASAQLGDLLTTGNNLWSVTGSIAQTVFDAGALRHKQKAAEAALAQAKAQYRSTVLGALQNTADVLQGIVADADIMNHALATEDAAGRSLRIAQAQFEHGQTGALAVLNAEVAYGQAETALAQARTARYADTVALMQALGGGWWARNDLAAGPKGRADR